MTQTQTPYEGIVRSAGAEFIAVRSGSVLFRDPKSSAVLSLYTSACSTENIRLSLKNKREDLQDPWMPTE